MEEKFSPRCRKENWARYIGEKSVGIAEIDHLPLMLWFVKLESKLEAEGRKHVIHIKRALEVGLF